MFAQLLLVLCVTSATRINFPFNCQDHYTYVQVWFSANSSFASFQAYLTAYVDLADCADNATNWQTYLFGTYFNAVKVECTQNRDCIRRLLANETAARQCFEAAKANTNGDAVQTDKNHDHINYMRLWLNLLKSTQSNYLYFRDCFSYVLVTDFAIANFDNDAPDIQTYIYTGIAFYLFTDRDEIRDYFPGYWTQIDSTNTSNDNNAAVCARHNIYAFNEPTWTSLHIYLAFENSTLDNPSTFLEHIFEFIDNIISDRLGRQLDSVCDINTADSAIVRPAYFCLYVRKNATYSIGFEIFWQFVNTIPSIREQIQQHLAQLTSAENIATPAVDDADSSSDLFFVEMEGDLLTFLQTPNLLGWFNSYTLLITNMISTYLTNSTQLNSLLQDCSNNSNFDIIFIDEKSNESIDEYAATAYRKLLSANDRSQYHFYYMDNVDQLNSEFETISFCATNTSAKPIGAAVRLAVDEKLTIPKSTNLFRIVLIAVSVAVAVITLVTITFVLRRQQKSKINRLLAKHNDDRIQKLNDGVNYMLQNNDNMRVKQWKIDHLFLAIDRTTIIGKGSEAIIYKGQLAGRAPVTCIFANMAEFSQFQDCEVAIKFEKKRSRLFGDRDYLQNEMHTLMRICRHPNVITLLGYTMSSMTAAGDHQRQQLGLVMELMHSDLRSYIDQTKLHLRKGITTSLTAGNQFLAIARQVAAGMSYIASCKLVHRDLAARNILLTEQFTAKICDFGLCTEQMSEDNPMTSILNFGRAILAKSERLPIRSMSIEALDTGIFNEKSDVWSFGVLLYEMFTFNAIPYSSVPLSDIKRRLIGGVRLQKPPFASDGIYKIMYQCWHGLPDLRFTFDELYEVIGNLLLETAPNYGYIEVESDVEERTTTRI